MNRFARILTLLLILLPANIALAQKLNPPEDQDAESSRQITLDRFNKARPLSEATAGLGSSSKGASKPPVYRRTGAARLPGRRGVRPPATAEIGVTVRRLRPSRANDEGARVLVLEGLKQSEVTRETLEVAKPVSIG